MSHNFGKSFEHQAGKRQKMQSGKRFRQSLVISRQAAESRRPPETALDHPPPRQQNEAFSGFRHFHHFKANPVRLSGLGGICARITHIHKGNFDLLARRRLHLFRQLANRRTVLNIGGRAPAKRADCPTYQRQYGFCSPAAVSLRRKRRGFPTRAWIAKCVSRRLPPKAWQSVRRQSAALRANQRRPPQKLRLESTAGFAGKP